MARDDFSYFPSRDLFGDPIEMPRGQGRPRYEPTDRDRRRVAKMHRAGRSHIQIARALGITAPTLRMNFPSELESMSIVRARRDQRDEQKEK